MYILHGIQINEVTKYEKMNSQRYKTVPNELKMYTYVHFAWYIKMK